MTFTFASALSLVLTFITVCVALPSQKTFCKIAEESKTPTGGKLIKVSCGEKSVLVDLLEGGTFSTLRVTGHEARNLLTVDYFSSTHDLFIVIDGQQFNVKDETSKAEEGQKFLQLLNDPEFESFPEAVRLIHDELQLKGWESPAVMFLYRIAIAAENYQHQLRKRSGLPITRREIEVDPDTYKYHGPNPELQCTFNGWSDPNMDNLIKDECRGVCGQMCSSCWQWVCNDCCAHTGCYRHDIFCDTSGYMGTDCLTCRGVLWDNITVMPYDC